MTNLINDPYAKRVKEYEKDMKYIAKLERGQRWGELHLAAQELAAIKLLLGHEIGSLRRKMHMIEDDLY